MKSALRNPASPYMRLWIELAARAARDEESYRAIAGRIADGFLAWAAERLHVEQEADRAPLAVLLLATVDGLALLDAVGHGAAADNAVERWSCPWPTAGIATVERKEEP